MITAVDTSVLLDVMFDDPKFCTMSLEALRRARRQGPLVVCPVVWSEVRACLLEPAAIGEVLAAAGIRFDPFDEACGDRAGDLWRRYRSAGGRREHLIPDFLIGAHAAVRGARLLARDRGFSAATSRAWWWRSRKRAPDVRLGPPHPPGRRPWTAARRPVRSWGRPSVPGPPVRGGL